MEQYIINGGNKLKGEVVISGAKNAALPILSAAIMSDEDIIINNLPCVNDILVMIDVINSINGYAKWQSDGSLLINAKNVGTDVIEGEYINKIRASYYFIGALLGKKKKVRVLLPGGCDIGSRPIDQHNKGFRSLGADINIEHGIISANAKELVGSHIFLDVVSVGATINIMMAAVLAKGTTVIENAAKEPHVVDTANFLNSMGANIKGAGTDVIRINGVDRLHGTEYTIIPDQIETGTFMFAAAATRGDILIKNVIPKHMEATTSKLIEMGCIVDEYDDSIRVCAENAKLVSTQVKTQPYPGFPTDLQPQMVVTLALASGDGLVIESIFENRFRYINELHKMGADIRVEGNAAIIRGVDRLTGSRLVSPDLRAGAALVIAALCAQGESVIEDIKYIKRGYEDYHLKLQKLGGKIDIRKIDNKE